MEERNFYAAPQAEIGPERPIKPWQGQGQMATRMQRLGAYFLDMLAFTVLYIPLVVALAMVDDGNVSDAAFAGLFGIFGLAVLALLGINLYLLYKNGQTIGKKLVGIKIVRSDMVSRASLKRIVFMRALPVWLVANLVPCLGSMAVLANYLAIFSAEQRCGHDYIADTHVVVDDGTVGTTDYMSDESVQYLSQADPNPRRHLRDSQNQWDLSSSYDQAEEQKWGAPVSSEPSPSTGQRDQKNQNKWTTPAAEKGFESRLSWDTGGGNDWDTGSDDENWDPGVDQGWDGEADSDDEGLDHNDWDFPDDKKF